MKNKYKVRIGNQSFESESDLQGLDIAQVNDHTLSIIFQNKVYEVTCESVDMQSKSFEIKVNGALHKVSLQDELDILIKDMGMKIISKRVSDNIISPMPGLMRQLHVKVGDTLEAGQAVLILEAMKMENILKAAGSGVVKEIHVKPGDAIEKGQLLVTVEPL